jgi:predicted metalloprotease
MKFGSNDSADSSSVEDRRGMGRVGVAGGGLGVVGVVIYLIVRALGGDVQTSGPAPTPSPDDRSSGHTPTSRTETTSAKLGGSCEGVTSGTDQAKFITCVETNVQNFWRKELAESQTKYDTSTLVLFTDRTQSGCGGADAAMGPFYCPRDRKVYLDLGFFDELKNRLGAKGGDFAEAYVIAHEYGHHVQDVLGIERRTRAQMERDRSARNELSVRLELQADCLAGVWGHAAFGEGKVAPEEVSLGHDAAAAVGDDRIQKRARGSVDPDSFTHGSSAERQRWFNTGMRTGSVDACDTFR